MRASTVFLLPLLASAAERTAFDSDGRLTTVIADGRTLAVTAELVVRMKDGALVRLQLGGEASPVRRALPALEWSGPAGNLGTFSVKAVETRVSYQLTASSPVEIDTAFIEIRVPRKDWLGGTLNGVKLPVVKPAETRFLHQETEALQWSGAGAARLTVRLDRPRTVTVEDRWDRRGRAYVVEVELASGKLDPAEPVSAELDFLASWQAEPTPAAHVSIDATHTGYRLDGFGGNYCFNLNSPVVEYTMKNLRSAWARVEIDLEDWDKERDNPGAKLKRYFEVAAMIQKRGIPWIASIWWLPERLYTDPNQQARSTHNRVIAADQWDNFLDLLGSYLLHMKSNYGAEPDLFSFNEANIGVYVKFTPDEHRDAIKRIGAHFARLGLRTKMLLADATGPRETHNYALPTAADAEALRYVGAVGMHSWGGGTPEQYRAWGDLAEWLGLPLVVAELGLDAFAHRNMKYNSYQYGMEELGLFQNLLRYARPRAMLYWEFTPDYGLVDRDLKPRGRFFLMKHFTDLTPAGGTWIETESDREEVAVTAFRKDTEYAIHLANFGPEREVRLTGLPKAAFQLVETTETSGFAKREWSKDRQREGTVLLPARSLTTMTTLQPPEL